MDEKALMEFLCSVRGFGKEIVQKILDSNAPCKRCLVIPGPGEFLFYHFNGISKKTFQNETNSYLTDCKNCIGCFRFM